jgi:hypothetical protein
VHFAAGATCFHDLGEGLARRSGRAIALAIADGSCHIEAH